MCACVCVHPHHPNIFSGLDKTVNRKKNTHYTKMNPNDIFHFLMSFFWTFVFSFRCLFEFPSNFFPCYGILTTKFYLKIHFFVCLLFFFGKFIISIIDKIRIKIWKKQTSINHFFYNENIYLKILLLLLGKLWSIE